MKTRKEWLEELPNPYKELALRNTPKYRLEEIEESLSESILGAFDWDKSSEGFKYWNNLWENL